MVYRSPGMSALLVQLVVASFAAIVLFLKSNWRRHRQRLGNASFRVESQNSREAFLRNG